MYFLKKFKKENNQGNEKNYLVLIKKLISLLIPILFYNSNLNSLFLLLYINKHIMHSYNDHSIIFIMTR